MDLPPQPATDLINVGSGGLRGRLALWGGPVRGLNPDGAAWPVGLHRSKSRAERSRVSSDDPLFPGNDATRFPQLKNEFVNKRVNE